MRWLAVLAVLLGAGWILWHAFGQKLHAPVNKSVTTPPLIVRVENVDPATLLDKFLVDGHIDPGRLAELENQGPPALAAAADFAAARYEHERNREETALSYIQRAVSAAPSNASLHAWCAVILMNNGQAAEAVSHAERAAQLDPASVEVQRILGKAYYQAGRLESAITTWEHAQQISPDEALAKELEKAKREAAVESRFTEAARGHFVLRYEGGKLGATFTDDAFRALERDYGDLSQSLGLEPRAAVTVVFYNEQQFADVTNSPAWVEGLNDGKMRIPLRDTGSVTPPLEALLRHELTHSFLQDRVPRCPTWLNEGLAQMAEPKDVATMAPAVAAQGTAGEFVPLSQMEGSFQAMTLEQARQAYLESLAATEVLRNTYGMDGLRRLLAALASGVSTEDALRSVTGGGYDDLTAAAKAYAAKYLPQGAAVR
ncbi:MAG: tetratricopeptide repeat protein [Acidobacteriota bacterium]|nr:tetratricopeptide repeat protein [Acidobacteriota bacterium]